MLFQANDMREGSLAEDVEWYHALVRSLVAGEPRAHRAVLAFDAHPPAARPRLVLQATQESPEILLQDVSAAAGRGDLSGDGRWFDALESQPILALRKRLLRNDLRSLETPKWSRGDGYVGDAGHVRWSPPFLECRDGKFLPAWMVTLSSSFYGLKPDLSPEFKGVVRLDVKLQDVELDPCASEPGWFADTHRCDLNSTQCVPQESRGFVLGSYLCRCKPGFYAPGGAASGAGAGTRGRAAGQVGAPEAGGRLACRPCRRGCAACVDDAPCLIEEDRALRAAVLCCQAACMLAVFLCMLVSYHFRRSKRIRASGLILLETILFGSLLLYFPVFILYFKPSIFRCIVLRWVRMLGFAIVYGTITLQLYRLLKAFLSRTAQRVPYMSSGRVLKMLGLILLLVLWFLAAWTAGMLQNVDKNIPLVVRSQTAGGLQFHLCGHDRWDYMMVMAEMLFLLWGSFLCFATRAVPSAFHEPRYLGIALHNELLVSAAFHAARFALVPSLHPDWTLLLSFAHTHGTVTATLALLFVPKFLHAGSPPREEIAAEVYEDELDGRRSGSYPNSSVASAGSERSLDPDDVRQELLKLYGQLEAQRTRRMAASNPHLPRPPRRAEPPRPAARRDHQRDGASPGGREAGESRSAEEHARRQPSELSSPARTAALAQGSDGESPAAAPLARKSASARELRAERRPPASLLQKSRSLGAGDEASLRAGRPGRRRRREPDGEEPPAASETPAARGCPRRGRARRHVSYAPVKSVSVDGAPPPGRVRVGARRTPPAPPARHRSLAPPRETGGSGTPSADAPARKASVGSPGLAASAFNPSGAKRSGKGEKEGEGAGDGGGSGGIGGGQGAGPGSLPAQESAADARGKLAGEPGSGRGSAGGTPGTAERGEPPRPPAVPAPVSSQETAEQPCGAASSDPSAAAAPKAEAAAAPEPEICAGEAPGAPAGKGASLKQEVIASREDRGVPPRGTRPAKALQQGSGQREPVRPGESADTQRLPARSGSPDAPPAPAGKAERVASRKAEVRPREPEADSSAKIEICRWEEGEGLPGTGKVGRDRGQASPEEALQTPRSRDAGETVPPKPAGATPREAVCPWESRGAEEAPAKAAAPSPDLLRLTARGAESGESKKAEVCPWETAEGHGSRKAEICPWDAGEVQPEKGKLEQDRMRLSKWVKSIRPKSLGLLRAQESGSSPPASARPWGSASIEVGSPQPAPKSPQLPKRTWRSPEGAGSAKASLCPWETDSDKAEICPWEASAALSDARKLKGDESETSRVKKGISARRAAPTEPSDTSQMAEQGSSRRGSVCPWDGAEGPGAGFAPKSPGLPQTPSARAAGSVESQKADVCPREAEDEPPARTETCPREASAAPADKEKLSQGTSGTFEEKNLPGARGIEAIQAKLAEEGGGGPESSVCPRERTGADVALPKLAKKSLERTKAESKGRQSAKAEVCPWEAEEPDASSKAEICPWEASEALPKKESKRGKEKTDAADKRITRQAALASPVKSSEERGSSEREAVCPWESLDAGQPAAKPRAGGPRLPKSPSRTSQSAESLKAEVCPWETQELEGGSKAEICPWDVAAPPSDREKSRQDKDGLSAASESASPKQSLFKETGESTSQKREKASRERESICPWESVGTEGSSARDGAGSTERLKATSRKSESAGSKAAEVCPWESLDTEEPAAKPRAGSPGLPKGPSKKPEGTDSRRADVCPWETAGADAGVRSEIRPWEVTGVPPDAPGQAASKGRAGSGRAAGAFAKAELGSSQRESVCPWESLGTEEPSLKTATGKSPPKKPESVESRKSDVCPWEAAEPEAAEKESVKAEVRPRGAARASSTEAGKPVAGADAASPTAPLKKSKGRAEGEAGHQPLCRILPGIQPPRGPGQGSGPGAALLPQPAPAAGSSPGRGTSVAEVCPWEAEGAPPAPDKTSPETSKTSAVCPWEAESADRIPTRRGQGRTGESPGDGDSGATESSPDVCPWDHE
ncbi:probable G-protein coupled receptor 179 [Struthio camelus]|uniref:probable G-protein coupled receptor 179 n=1 Tax=Struthio camelus TaxID=8801 RepID=UPI003603E920